MQPYNVEIFDRQFNLIQHYNIDSIEYEYDYLCLSENHALIPFNDDVKRGMYIRVNNPVYEYFGVVTSIEIDNSLEGFSEIRFKPFLSLFDTDIVFDTTVATDDISLEDMIIDYIDDYFITNIDDDQLIMGLELEKLTDTFDWTILIQEQSEGTGRAIINLLTDLIQPSLVRHRVALYVTPDFTNKKIHVEVGIKEAADFVIEAELPNVVAKNVILNQTTKEVNKLYVYQSDNFNNSLIYYLHTDGSFSTSDTDRITPVVFETRTASVSQDKTFSQSALEVAANTFGDLFAANLIELVVLRENWLIDADSMEIGQMVSILLNGAEYKSMLTGYKRKDTMELIFGTIRMDLTKILKEALK